MIETRQITKAMGEKLILKDVSVTIGRGESVAVLGPNGAGKSTWLKIVSGLIRPTSGTVAINGKIKQRDNYANQALIGYLGHQSFLYDQFSPVENLTYYAKLYGMKKPEKRIDELIERINLQYFKHEPLRSFSRGMVQRTAIARAILHEPKILLLDEPHTGLDQQSKSWFREMIASVHQEGVTVVMVTHEFDQMLDVSDRVLIFRNGRLTEDQHLNESVTLSGVKSLYDRQVVGS